MRYAPPSKATTQFTVWMAMEDQGQVPVCCSYNAHQRRVLRPSLYIVLTGGSIDIQLRFPLRARAASSESSSTKSTSQSEQRADPGRYRALHSGQNITSHPVLGISRDPVVLTM